MVIRSFIISNIIGVMGKAFPCNQKGKCASLQFIHVVSIIRVYIKIFEVKETFFFEKLTIKLIYFNHKRKKRILLMHLIVSELFLIGI